MLKSNASRIVLVLLLFIAALELAISGKFAQVWAMAFNPGGSTSGANTSGATSQPTTSGSTSGGHVSLR